MRKPFITYTDQIEKLKNEKNLIIEDIDFAVESLKNISYYALIGGYKHPFIDIHTRKYRNDVCFEEIVSLYEFDEELRGIFFKYLCRVERRMRSAISYHFCAAHGECQEEYLNPANYSKLPKYKNGIAKLIRMLDIMANKNTDHEYIVYQRNKYHNIPFWVIINALTFGQISKMFEFLPQNMQGVICREFGNIKKNEMIKYLRVLTLYRNVCAHNERLFSYRTYIDIPDTIIHEKLCISKNGSKYICGKNDLFSVFIAFRYLLPKEDFIQFKTYLVGLFKRYEKNSRNLDINALLKYMGFPYNWKEITRFRKI
ncbi:MAG: Abi family protein [Lachnospiraceae bacterium]